MTDSRRERGSAVVHSLVDLDRTPTEFVNAAVRYYLDYEISNITMFYIVEREEGQVP